MSTSHSQPDDTMGTKGLPIDRGWAWMIVIGNFTSVFCMAGIGRSFGIFIEEFVTYFETSVAMAAAVMGVYGGVYTLAAPICVSAGEHYSQRRVVMVGGVVGAAGLCLGGLLLNIQWVIVVIGVMFGIGNGSIFGNGLVMINQYFNKRRSLANGLSLSGASVGLFAIPPLLQFLLDKYSLQGTLIIVGGIYLHVTVCGALYRPLSYFKTNRSNGLPIPRTHRHLHESGDGVSPDGRTMIHSAAEEITVYNKHDDILNKSDGLVESVITVELSKQDTLIQNCISVETNERKQQKYQHEELLHEANTEDKPEILSKNYHASAVGDRILHVNEENIDQDGIQYLEDISSTESKQVSKVVSQVKQFVTGLLDLSVLKQSEAVIFVIASFLFFFGHFNFLMFMPSSAYSRGVSKYQKAYLVSINGLCDLVGRLSVGAVGDLQLARRDVMLACTTFLCGAAIFSFTFANTFVSMAIFGGLYGFFGGGYVTINVPALIDLVGMKAMPKVLGVVLFIQGIGAAIGLPMLGALRDLTGSYYTVHCINGLAMMLGAVILLTFSCTRKRHSI